MKNLKQDLLAANKQLAAISKKIENLISAVSKTEKLKATKAKLAGKPVVKLRKKATAKKTAGKTTPEIVMDVIQNSKQGG